VQERIRFQYTHCWQPTRVYVGSDVTVARESEIPPKNTVYYHPFNCTVAYY
jgi:hypothetical protein